MISRIRGTIVRRDLGVCEVMTDGGVGYELAIPTSVFERLPGEGSPIELRTVLVVREDAHTLYGFLEESERVLFTRLLAATGIGPKLALAMLSRFSPGELVGAISARDVALLKQVPGLGAKKAERLALELADKVEDLAGEVANAGTDTRGSEEATLALVALGYPAAQAKQAVRSALDECPGLTGVDLIKAALAALAR